MMIRSAKGNLHSLRVNILKHSSWNKPVNMQKLYGGEGTFTFPRKMMYYIN